MKRSLLWLALLFLVFGCAKKEIPVGPLPQETAETVETVEPESVAPQVPPEIPSMEETKPEVLEAEKAEALGTAPEFEEETLEAAARKAEKLPVEERWRLYGRSTPPLKAIFFDFDDYRIREDMIQRLRENARFLIAHPEYRIELQGNCDERGDKDYNLALGEKRALEVKRFLINLGVSPDRLTTVSFGEERPLAMGHDERSWALNRRVDLVIINE